MHVVGAHTDSPNLHIKPVSRRTTEGYLQCAVEAYGGGLWSTWFDRDLSVAGRVIVADSPANTSFTARLVHIHHPLLRIPNLAIHLNRTAGDNFTFNKEDNTLPILGLVSSELNQPAATAPPGAVMVEEAAVGAVPDSSAAVGAPTMGTKHHSVLLGLLAAELGVDVSAIQDFELSLYDTQPATVGGVDNAFIFSPRLDNQMSCFCATEALIASVEDDGALARSGAIRAICLFDNEEVGSVSTHGAESNLLAATVKRLASVRVAGGPVLDAAAYTSAEAAYETAIAHSFLLSSDMAHAFHPNYSSKYEANHRPRLNAGPVIKTNANQRYASTAPTTFLLRRVARAAAVPLQEFEVRNDMPCGSTIGPMLSKTGIRTVDIGNPQLAMHSIREMCGSHDPAYKIRLFTAFFDHFEHIDQELTVD